MARSLAGRLVTVAVLAYGLYSFLLYGLMAVVKGTFFRRPTEQESLELQLAHDRFWNLSRKWCGLAHRFAILRSGLKLHYVCNDGAPGNDVTSASSPSARSDGLQLPPLVIFIHGFPDSWALWRHILRSPSLQDSAILVAVDLPGYGGSDSLSKYSATNLLEVLTEFIISVRARYGADEENQDHDRSQGKVVGKNPLQTGRRLRHRRKVIVVAHDWGCVLSMRLAAEAPQLADRFILTNGPVPGLVKSNFWRLLSSAQKMLKTAWHSPLQSRSILRKAAKTIQPIVRQIALSRYIFILQLPMTFVRFLGSGGNYSFLKGIHKNSHASMQISVREAAESMASTLGPSAAECQTETPDGQEYPDSVKHRVRLLANFEHMTSYYRDGAGTQPWNKSIETIAALHEIRQGTDIRRASSGAGVFDDGPEGVLEADSTIIWGRQDAALEPQLCLDGIADYLTRGCSQVVILPRSGHFTPIELESRLALENAVVWAVHGEKEDLGAVVEACYPKAVVAVRK